MLNWNCTETALKPHWNCPETALEWPDNSSIPVGNVSALRRAGREETDDALLQRDYFKRALDAHITVFCFFFQMQFY